MEQIQDICEELRQSVKQYASEESDESKNGSDFKLANKIESIIKETAAKVAPRTDTRPLTEKKLRAQKAELERLNFSVQRISDEIQSQTQKFNDQIDDEKRKFKHISNDMADHYYEQCQSENSAHNSQMLELEDELFELKTSFDSKLQDEKEKVVIEKKLLKKVYQSFQKEYDAMKDELEDDLNETRGRIGKMEAEIKNNYGESERQIKELHEKIEFKEEEGKMELAKLEEENKAIREKIEAVKNEKESKIQELLQKIEESENDYEIKLSELLKANQPKFEAEIGSINEKFAVIENELSSKLENIKNSRSSATDALQSELVRLKSEVNSSDSKIAKKLKIARAQLDAKVLAKDSELKQLRSDHLRFVKTTRHAYQAELSRVRNETENHLVLLEQSLMKTVANAGQRNRHLASKLRIKEPSSGAPAPTPRRIKNVRPPKEENNMEESLSVQFDTRENEARKRLSEFSAAKKKAENEIRTNRAKACAQINELEKATKTVREELNQILKQMEDENSSNEIESLTPREEELKNSIEQQKLAIQQLKEEKDRLRVDVSKRRALQSLQLKLRNDEQAIEAKIQEVMNNVDNEIDDTADEMIKLHKEEQKKSSQLIQEASMKLEAALKELIDAKAEAEEVSLKDRQKWGELRSGISESTLMICKKLSTRPTSSSPTRQSQSMLPPLKKDK